MNVEKSRIICWCCECGQGYVYIVKNAFDGKLYGRCEETGTIWKSPEDVKNGVPFKVKEWRYDFDERGNMSSYYVDFDGNAIRFSLTGATDEEIAAAGWQYPLNKVKLCAVCSRANGR